MKPFRERNLTVIGLIGFVVIVLVLLAAFRADRLPIIGAGDEYKASFAEVGGLKEGNEVRVGGFREPGAKQGAKISRTRRARLSNKSFCSTRR